MLPGFADEFFHDRSTRLAVCIRGKHRRGTFKTVTVADHFRNKANLAFGIFTHVLDDVRELQGKSKAHVIGLELIKFFFGNRRVFGGKNFGQKSGTDDLLLNP